MKVHLLSNLPVEGIMLLVRGGNSRRFWDDIWCSDGSFQ